MIYLVTYIQHGLFLSTSYVYMHFSFWLLKWREWLWNYSNSFGHVIMHAVNMYLYIKKKHLRKTKCRAFGGFFTRPKQHTCYSFYHNFEALDLYLILRINSTLYEFNHLPMHSFKTRYNTVFISIVYFSINFRQEWCGFGKSHCCDLKNWIVLKN